MKVTVRKIESEDQAELFLRYRSEFFAQPVHLYVDLETGEISTETWGEIGGGTTFNVVHGVTPRWRWNGTPTVAQANEAMEAIAPLAQKMIDGVEVEFKDGNWVGTLITDEARDAEEKIGEVLGDMEGLVTEVDADWFFQDTTDLDLSAETTDEEIEEIVANADYHGDDGELYVVLGAEAYLQGLRDDLKEED